MDVLNAVFNTDVTKTHEVELGEVEYTVTASIVTVNDCDGGHSYPLRQVVQKDTKYALPTTNPVNVLVMYDFALLMVAIQHAYRRLLGNGDTNPMVFADDIIPIPPPGLPAPPLRPTE